MDSSQYNIRMSKDLLYDLEWIAENLKINKNDWLRVRIAEIIRNEKRRLMIEIEDSYYRGSISDKEFKEKMGFAVPAEIRERKEIGLKATRRYIEDAKK